LRHSVDAAAFADAPPSRWEDAFRRGALKARERALSGVLFSVRARALLEGQGGAENAAYLSGLLIGAEAIDAAERARPGTPVVLCAGRKLSGVYELAFEALGLAGGLEVVPPEVAETASARGHGVLLGRVVEG
jgi:2-keto-3-deoxy-galactonokinase